MILSRPLKTVGLALALSGTMVSLVQAQAVTVPDVAARSYLLLDVNANQVLAQRAADTVLDPASLTKLMTAYLVFTALHTQKLSLEQELTVSDRAWKTGMSDASRMYVQVGSKVKVEDLIKGMIVQSGNDATVVLAEAVGGTVENFVDMMNRQAKAFGLKTTQFKNPDGLPDAGHVSTARELGVIATRLLRDFPDEVKYYSIKEFTFNKITQPNRNLLLWRDPSVDGLKTGFTDAAGYCLIATAKRDMPSGQRRLLSVVMGTASKEARANESQKLLNWGYAAWDSVKLYDAKQAVTTAPIWKGTESTVQLGLAQPLVVTVPKGQAAQLKPQMVRTDPLLAPLQSGQKVGTLKVMAGDTVVAEAPVIALETVAEAGFFRRLWDTIRLWIK